MVLSVPRRLIAGRVSLGVEYDLRNRLYRHLQSLELGFFDRQQVGQLMSRVTVDLQAIRFFLGYGLVFILQNLLTILLAAAVMFYLQPSLAAITLAPVPLVIAAAARYGRYSRPALQEVQQRIAELTAEAEENISGIRIVKAFAREEHRQERFRDRVGRVFDQSMYSTRLRAFYNPMISFLPNLGLAAVLLVGGRQVVNGTHHARRVRGVQRLPADADVPDAHARESRSGWRSARSPPATACSRSSTAPPRSSRPPTRCRFRPAAGTSGSTTRRSPTTAARRRSSTSTLDVAPGETVAVVGPTGSGKTTLVAAIARLYDVTSRIGLDRRARRARRSTPTSCAARSRSCPTTASSSPRPCARTSPMRARTPRSEEVELAARRAQIHAFIETLPDGYETLVGERGLTLSGGQRQRIAIARALITDPRILILDDATASVDAATEREIKRALREVMDGRTTFVIAHRLSTIMLADRIVVMEDGRITAVGTHEQLLEESPVYGEIVEKGMPRLGVALSGLGDGGIEPDELDGKAAEAARA